MELIKVVEDETRVTLSHVLWHTTCVMVCQKLLQVLEEASVAEVIDVSTEKHQLWVDVIGHTVVGGHGVANNGWHHKRGGTVKYALPTAFYQGTKSGNRKIQVTFRKHSAKNY